MALKCKSEWIQNQEFGILAISKLICHLGKGKNADVEEKTFVTFIMSGLSFCPIVLV